MLLSCASPPKDEGSGEKPSAGQTAEHHGVHNVIEVAVIEVAPKLISGSVPEGDDGFDELKRLGIRTILSVDGATPDLERAKRYGMRYVHLPIGYHGIDLERQLEIARAVRDLEGPVYVHCHHGKHRGPAAAASAAVALNLLTSDEGIAFMEKAGTSDSYAGLYKCVRELEPASAEQLDTVSNDFPELAPVPGFVKAMAEAQSAYDHLVEIKDAGWRAPASHPDLVPLAEAGRLEGLMRNLREDPEVDEHDDDFREMLEASWKAARQLEESINGNAPTEERAKLLKAVNDSCKSCHTVYRNVR